MRDTPTIWTPRDMVDRGPDAQRLMTLIESRSRPGSIIGVNAAKLYEYPFFLTTDSPNNPVVVGARASSPLLTQRVSMLGPAEVVALSVKATSTARVSMQISDGSTPRTLMNFSQLLTNMFGVLSNVNSPNKPYRLSEGIYVIEGGSLDIALTDTSGSSNSIYPVAHCARYTSVKYDPKLAEIRKRLADKQFISMPFWYTTDGGPVAVTGSAAATAGISIASDHHFLLRKISATATSRNFTINLTNLGTGKSLIDGTNQDNFQIPASLWLGDGNFPFVLPEPFLFEAGDKIRVDLTDLSGSTNTVDLCLHGSIIKTRMWR